MSRRPGLRVACAAAMLTLLATAGCGGQTGHRLPVTGVLSVRAVSWLPAITRPITPADVQKDSTARGLAARLRRWGYAGGWERTFQGESRRLTLVVSRSLTFRSNPGAKAFVGYLTRHLDAFYPYALRHPLTLAGQSGWLIKPPECACHMAEPLYVGVTAAGRQVRWLEINGPQATGKLLASLLGQT